MHSRLILSIGSAINLLLVSSSLGFAAECGGRGPAASYHPPSHPAEQTLDRLIKKEEVDDYMLDFILKDPYRDVEKDEKYEGLFTPALESAWAKARADDVKKNCGGRYKKGELCGLETDPLTCADLYPDEDFLYRMDCQDESSATISLRWPGIKEPAGTYRLLKQGEGWVLDGVTCLSDGHRFNMPKPSAPAR